MPIKEQQSNPKTLLYFVLHNSRIEETKEQNKIWQKLLIQNFPVSLKPMQMFSGVALGFKFSPFSSE